MGHGSTSVLSECNQPWSNYTVYGNKNVPLYFQLYNSHLMFLVEFYTICIVPLETIMNKLYDQRVL